jgi:ABC-type nickel/cobalt efflux system permease component RcnA
MTMSIRALPRITARTVSRALHGTCLILLIALGAAGAGASRADTVASLLGNFTINQYCGLKLTRGAIDVHYAVVFGQLPALRELHLADANADGVTSQEERDAYVEKLAPDLARNLVLKVDGVSIPLRATHWASSLPSEQGGFSLRVEVDFVAPLPPVNSVSSVEFTNENYPGRMGWHEIVVQTEPGLAAFDTNAYSDSLTGGLTEALKSLPPAGPLDERSVHLRYQRGSAPANAAPLAPRPQAAAKRSGYAAAAGASVPGAEKTDWIARETRRLVDSISGPRVEPQIAILALLGALLLGAVHALSPGHGKTIVGAYLIGSRGTPRHALFLGLTVTITHTLGVFVLGFATLYASRFIVPERLIPILSLISALLVLGMGIVLLVQRARAARRALFASSSSTAAPVFHAVEPATGSSGRALVFAHAHEQSFADGTLHSHGGGPMHSHLPPGAAGEKITWRSLATLGISGGLVPCPSAMVLLLATIALNKTAYGMLLVVAFSAGLAVTLTAVGMMFLYARNRFRGPIGNARWHHLLPVLSAGTITLLGAGLCIGALMSFGWNP